MCVEKVNKEIAIFNNPEFGKIRVLLRDGEVWFIANDVCAILELENTTRALETLEEDEKSVLAIFTNSNCPNDCKDLRKDTRIVSESGLYALIFKSRKPEAKKFRKWVTSEVLPAIRKTGKYELAQNTPLDYPTALRALADEAEKRMLVEKRFQETAEARWQERTKVAFANNVSRSHGLITVGELSKIIKQAIPDVKIGRNRMYRWLRLNGWMLKTGKNKFEPSQHSIEKGLMRIKVQVIQATEKTSYVQYTTLITSKGVEFFCEQFQKSLLI